MKQKSQSVTFSFLSVCVSSEREGMTEALNKASALKRYLEYKLQQWWSLAMKKEAAADQLVPTCTVKSKVRRNAFLNLSTRGHSVDKA